MQQTVLLSFPAEKIFMICSAQQQTHRSSFTPCATIIISSYDWSDIEIEARAAGANAFINKPLFRSRLAKTFNILVGEEQSKEQEMSHSELQNMDLTGYRALLVEYNELNAEIAMTANAFAEDVLAAKTVGMNEHISKPLDLNAIAKTLKKWLLFIPSPVEERVFLQRYVKNAILRGHKTRTGKSAFVHRKALRISSGRFHGTCSGQTASPPLSSVSDQNSPAPPGRSDVQSPPGSARETSGPPVQEMLPPDNRPSRKILQIP